MKIKAEELKAADLPYSALEDTVVDNSRWSIQHEVVFRWVDGKFYRAYYSVGATEQQDETPWEYANEIDCIEVEKMNVTVSKWMPVEAKS